MNYYNVPFVVNLSVKPYSYASALRLLDLYVIFVVVPFHYHSNNFAILSS